MPEDAGWTRRKFLTIAGLTAGGMLATTAIPSWVNGVFGEAEYQADRKAFEMAAERIATFNLEHPVYLGNVNDFDRSYWDNVPAGIGVPVEYGIIGDVKTDFKIPKYLEDTLVRKKTNIKVLHLKTYGSPYGEKAEKLAEVVKNGLKQLFPGLTVSTETGTIGFPDGMKFTYGGIQSEEQLMPGKEFVLGSDTRYVLLLSNGLEEMGEALFFGNFAAINLPKATDEARERRLYKTVLQEVGHMFGLPHCWEYACPMSYAFMFGEEKITTDFGRRCRLIASNISGGRLEERNSEAEVLSFVSGRSVPHEKAVANFQEHLMGFIRDVGRLDVPRLETTADLSREQDVLKLRKSYGGTQKDLGKFWVRNKIKTIHGRGLYIEVKPRIHPLATIQPIPVEPKP